MIGRCKVVRQDSTNQSALFQIRVVDTTLTFLFRDCLLIN